MSARHRPADTDLLHDSDTDVTRSYRLAELTDEQREALRLLDHDGNRGSVRLTGREWRTVERVAEALSVAVRGEQGSTGIGTPQDRPGASEGVA